MPVYIDNPAVAGQRAAFASDNPYLREASAGIRAYGEQEGATLRQRLQDLAKLEEKLAGFKAGMDFAGNFNSELLKSNARLDVEAIRKSLEEQLSRLQNAMLPLYMGQRGMLESGGPLGIEGPPRAGQVPDANYTLPGPQPDVRDNNGASRTSPGNSAARRRSR